MQKYILFYLVFFLVINSKADYLDQAETKANDLIQPVLDNYYSYEEKPENEVYILEDPQSNAEEAIEQTKSNTVTLIRLPKTEACKISENELKNFQDLKKRVCNKISSSGLERLEAKLLSFQDCPNIQ